MKSAPLSATELQQQEFCRESHIPALFGSWFSEYFWFPDGGSLSSSLARHFFKWSSSFTYLPHLSFLLKSAPLLCKSFIHSTLLQREVKKTWTNLKFTYLLPLPSPQKTQNSYSDYFLHYLPCKIRQQPTKMKFNQKEHGATNNYFLLHYKPSNSLLQKG